VPRPRMLIPFNHHTTPQRQHTGNKPLTSPQTNMDIKDASLSLLVPNVAIRGLVSDYKAAKKREWAAAERRWQEQQQQQQQGGGEG
jgi:hypothetical protein